MEMETGRSMEWDTKHYITKPKVVRINLLRSCNDVVNVGVLVLHDYTFSMMYSIKPWLTFYTTTP